MKVEGHSFLSNFLTAKPKRAKEPKQPETSQNEKLQKMPPVDRNS